MPHYKVAHHVHTTNSDGDYKFSSVIEEHYRKGYDAVCITDHNFLTRDWVTVTGGISPDRFAEIQAGVGRGGRGMLQIPLTLEPSNDHHLCVFFTDMGAGGISQGLSNAQSQGGLSHLNHPGRYTGGQYGPGPSNDPSQINTYVGYFTDFSTCVGFEIINKRDEESANDRILWDNVNQSMRSLGRRLVWGFSNDDSHANRDVGWSFNVFIAAENTLGAFRSVMNSGTFYAVARVARNEGINSHIPDATGGWGIPGPEFPEILSQPTPVIRRVLINPPNITITAENYNRIDWIGQGSAVIGQGSTFNASSVTGQCIRANVIGTGAIAFTQPFAIPLQSTAGWSS